MTHLIRSDYSQSKVMDVTPQSAGWDYLSYRILRLGAGQTYSEGTGGEEIVLVPLSGSGNLRVGDQRFSVSRKGVFDEKATVLYVPPGHTLEVTASSAFEFAIGGAPAEGKYPLRLFTPDEMKSEIRGGGAATRQVIHTLAHPLPAERLIVYEVYVPGGSWSGYPPHCHDRYAGSPYLEEVYYFRTTPQNGWGFHRNYRVDEDFDESFAIKDTDCVLVTKGFHSTAAAPGSNVYFLNYLAGELLDEARGTPSYDDPQYAHLKGKLDNAALSLPIVE